MSGNTIASIAGVSAGAAAFIVIPLLVVLIVYCRHKRRAPLKVQPFNPRAASGGRGASVLKGDGRLKSGDLVRSRSTPQPRLLPRSATASNKGNNSRGALMPPGPGRATPRSTPQLRPSGSPSSSSAVAASATAPRDLPSQPLVIEEVVGHDDEWFNENAPRGRFAPKEVPRPYAEQLSGGVPRHGNRVGSYM
eukprot:scaffold261864_cov23-Tisochrysis_lutea.AAC.1